MPWTVCIRSSTVTFVFLVITSATVTSVTFNMMRSQKISGPLNISVLLFVHTAVYRDIHTHTHMHTEILVLGCFVSTQKLTSKINKGLILIRSLFLKSDPNSSPNINLKTLFKISGVLNNVIQNYGIFSL